MARRAVQAYFFVLVIVEHQRRFLLIRETNHGKKWYFPAGGVEPGETLVEAAVRETLEEAGVLVQPVGLIRLDQSWGGSGDGLYTRWRYALVARPVGSIEPKKTPDEHSLEARWVDLADVALFDLRGDEVIELFEMVHRGTPTLPIEQVLALSR